MPAVGTFCCHKMLTNYARVILNVKDKRHVSTVTLSHMLGWLPIDVDVHCFTAVTIFTTVDGQDPAYPTEMFIQNNTVTTKTPEVVFLWC